MNNKDTIYVDVEDEITGIIGKVTASKSKVVALVLPKRATVFQSIVNMKLLKKRAEGEHKKVVLVTSDHNLLPLAGAVGVHVAKSLQDTPEIPPAPQVDDEGPLDVDDDVDADKEVDSSRPIGELAGLAAVGAAVAKSNEDEPIEVDNESLDSINLEDEDEKPKKSKKKAKNIDGKKTKIPNFDSFRKRLLIGAGILALLIVLWIICFKVLPKATIIVQTNTSTVSTNLTLTLSQSEQNLDPTNNVVPAKLQTVQKTNTSTAVTTTGSKTIGTSATGTITVSTPSYNCVFPCTVGADSIPAGTVFTDPSGNYSYASNSAVTVPGYTCHGTCHPPSIPSVSVTATNIGSGYNIKATSGYTSTGTTANGVSMSNYNMSGSSMNGGSSSTVQAVAQADITSAQGQLPQPPSSAAEEQQIESTLKQAGYTPITVTYLAGTPTYTPSATVGTQANSITVTENVTYSMYGVKEKDLNTLIVNNVNQQINPAKQSILDTGVSGATFTLVSNGASSSQVTMQATSTIGPSISVAVIKKESLGVKSGDIKAIISTTPGVTNVIVKYSPFWVSSTPKDINKVTVVIEKANGSQP